MAGVHMNNSSQNETYTSDDSNINYIYKDYNTSDYNTNAYNTNAYNTNDYNTRVYRSYNIFCFIIYKNKETYHFINYVVQKDHVTQIYVISVLISDLVQLSSMIAQVTPCLPSAVFFHIYYFGVISGVGFMVCVAMERYLVIAWPVWYRFRRTVKIYLMVSAVVWTLPLVYVLPLSFGADPQVVETILAVFFLLPYPLLVFFLGGTLKALHPSVSVPPEEKRRIVAVLVLVLLIYTLIFLPTAIWSLAEDSSINTSFSDLSFTLIKFSPLADSFLYVFLRKGAADKLLAFLCFYKLESNDTSRSTV
ncbi:G-protein coupled receptor 4-like [Anabas testudineus]|uniref:G-protein coupled receptor 4-like n=1 Tax=Anabas testudineus TaxID=64144 RepID=UPI000E46505B|nr:G-protein coupled receptor 4-like [Anabas testudineus]